MPTVKQHIQIDATADETWQVAGDPARIADWLPPIETSHIEGDRRSCTLAEGGGQIEERILEHSDTERRYHYEILDGPMPLSSYVSTFEVEDHDGHAHVAWTAQFEPQDAGQEQELVGTIEEMYSGGLAALKQKVEHGEG
ncbi:MAG: SRPBCC family protein [Actinobacteria bacterium]|nr:SRPBCC family protein [Actinomycetota bacterium]